MSVRVLIVCLALSLVTMPTWSGEKVDRHVFAGWRWYGELCMRCHGPGGEGGSYAPALIPLLPRPKFDDAVLNGRASGTAVMEPFSRVTDAVDHLDDIYRYLSARADGTIGRERPQVLDGQ